MWSFDRVSREDPARLYGENGLLESSVGDVALGLTLLVGGATVDVLTALHSNDYNLCTE